MACKGVEPGVPIGVMDLPEITNFGEWGPMDQHATFSIQIVGGKQENSTKNMTIGWRNSPK